VSYMRDVTANKTSVTATVLCWCS